MVVVVAAVVAVAVVTNRTLSTMTTVRSGRRGRFFAPALDAPTSKEGNGWAGKAQTNETKSAPGNKSSETKLSSGSSAKKTRTLALMPRRA